MEIIFSAKNKCEINACLKSIRNRKTEALNHICFFFVLKMRQLLVNKCQELHSIVSQILDLLLYVFHFLV